MSIVDGFFDEIKNGLEDLIRNTLGDIIEGARNDANDFLERTRDRLSRWVEALSQGILKKDEFEFLVKGQSDLAQMHALQTLGIVQTKIERFRKGLISLVINAAFKVVAI